jgi:arginyl-tRNA synthetase
VITLDLRGAIARAAASTAPAPTAGPASPPAPADPKLRPGARPGTFATPIAFTLAERQPPHQPAVIAQALAGQLSAEPFVAQATVTGAGFVTITVTDEALAAVAARVITAGPSCARSGILNGVTVSATPAAGAPDWARAVTWEQARAALAAQLTPRLAAAAGATVTEDMKPLQSHHAKRPHASRPNPPRLASGAVAGAVAFAGEDVVRFALARAVPGRPVRIDPASIARQIPGNPAYAVRYAHARAASGLRWVAALGDSGKAAQPCLPADPADRALLDALSWLPERVASAARRERPDEFARYLEGLASATIAALPFVGHGRGVGQGHSAAPGDNERLALTRALAAAARTGMAAGLGLLGVAAPEVL